MNLNWLLVFVPVSVGLNWMGANPVLVFLTSALAIIPLAGLMGDATEVLATYLGPTVGGLLNATLGNAPEIIISSFVAPSLYSSASRRHPCARRRKTGVFPLQLLFPF